MTGPNEERWQDLLAGHKSTGLKIAVALTLGAGVLALARGGNTATDGASRRVAGAAARADHGQTTAPAARGVAAGSAEARSGTGVPAFVLGTASVVGAGSPGSGSIAGVVDSVGADPAAQHPAATAAQADTAASYVLPPLGANVFPQVAAPRVPKPDTVRGIYLNAWAAGSRRKLAKLIGLAERTEINTFVIDIKDASGYVSYRTGVAVARQIGADQQLRIHDVREMLATLREKGIYPIARIVLFKDPLLARRRPDWAVKRADGTTWIDHNGELWVDSYNRDVWDYNIALAREAILLGFSEVQWDYVRFPDVPARYMRNAVYPAQAGRTRAEAIRAFLQYSSEKLADLNVPVTADVFGLTVSAGDDMGIGQSWGQMVDVTDVLLPMVYPSHFAKGSYGIALPNADPYQTVKTAMEYAIRRTTDVPDAALIRPWLQDFTLGWPSYGPAEVRAQIQATYDAGLSEWILWNASSDYTEAALAPAGGEPPALPIPRHEPRITVRDSLGHPLLDSLPVPRLVGVPVESQRIQPDTSRVK